MEPFYIKTNLGFSVRFRSESLSITSINLLHHVLAHASFVGEENDDKKIVIGYYDGVPYEISVSYGKLTSFARIDSKRVRFLYNEGLVCHRNELFQVAN